MGTQRHGFYMVLHSLYMILYGFFIRFYMVLSDLFGFYVILYGFYVVSYFLFVCILRHTLVVIFGGTWKFQQKGTCEKIGRTVVVMLRLIFVVTY